MFMKDYITWGNNIPEFVQENSWHLEIKDTAIMPFDNIPFYKMYLTEQMLDYAISEITFPQEELQFEKTSFGLPILKDLAEYSEVTISYYDYVSSAWGMKCPITNFFQAWMDTIYDKDKRCVKNRWRYHAKDIQVTLSKYVNRGGLGAIASNLGSSASALGSVGIALSKNLAVLNTSEVVEAEYTLEKCYPMKLSELNLGNDSGERKEFSVDLLCERVVPKFPLI